MKEFIRRLGKKVQRLLDKVFGRKNREPQEKVLTGSCWGFNNLGPGEIFIDGQSFGRVESISTFSKDEVTTEQQDELYSIYGLGLGDSDGKINCGWVEIPSQPEIQENFFNIPLTLLPKRYLCKTLLISIAANQESDYIAVDMSQYEKKGLAHYICGREADWEEILNEYAFTENDRDFFQEEIEKAKEYGVFSSVLKDATLLHYETLGLWEIEE